MLYCTKCHGVCQDSTMKCPNCKSSKLRQVDEEDMVLLHRASQYAAQCLEQRFQEQGVVYEMEPFDGGRISYLYDSDVMPTDKMVLVRWKDYPTAQKISVQLKEELERDEEPEEEFQPMSGKKRIIVQALSVIAFLVLVMLVVYGADAAANWLKGLWS